MAALPDRKYTIAEYVDLLKKSEERLEYFDGVIVSMAGGSASHSRAAHNVATYLDILLQGSDCEVFNGEMAVRTPTLPPFRFPEASVACGEAIFERLLGIDMLVNPRLIVEVLSASTAAFDHDDKFLAYQAVESFQEYLLVSQGRPHVTHYVRQSDASWRRRDIIGLKGHVELESVGVTLALSSIYRRVKFTESEADQDASEPQG
jgi:Uma2 family endonuclease